MKVTIDTDKGQLIQESEGRSRVLPLYSSEAFEQLSRQWLTVGWALKYSYNFTWMGRPVIQLPEDMIRIQELIFQLKPDVIIETGVAHGGSLIYYASLCQILGKGRIIGVDIEIRSHNRQAIESHPLFPYITLIEGNAIAPETVDRVRALVKPDEKVLVLLDSCHTRSHVLGELRAYSDLVSKGSYIVATDGIMQDVAHVPGGKSDWGWNNPARAAEDFAQERGDFVLQEPPRLFSESPIRERVTYWPSAYLKRVA